MFLIRQKIPLGLCQSDDYIGYHYFSEDETEGVGNKGAAENYENSNMRHTGGLKIDIDIPFFFWLFLIMAGIWYLFVFRVLCCHKTCGNSDVAIGMYIIETPVFDKKITKKFAEILFISF